MRKSHAVPDQLLCTFQGEAVRIIGHRICAVPYRFYVYKPFLLTFDYTIKIRLQLIRIADVVYLVLKYTVIIPHIVGLENPVSLSLKETRIVLSGIFQPIFYIVCHTCDFFIQQLFELPDVPVLLLHIRYIFNLFDLSLMSGALPVLTSSRGGFMERILPNPL